jgi:hypothetical protein
LGYGLARPRRRLYVPYSPWKTSSKPTRITITSGCAAPHHTIRNEKQNWEYGLVFFLKTMAKQKDKLAAKGKEEQVLRSSFHAR